MEKGPQSNESYERENLETVPFQPYFGYTKSFPKVLSNWYCQATRAMRAKRVETVPMQTVFWVPMNQAIGIPRPFSTGVVADPLLQIHCRRILSPSFLDRNAKTMVGLSRNISVPKGPCVPKILRRVNVAR